MDFSFTEEQRMWHDTLHNFMEKEVGREYTREHDASREFPYEIYRKMAEQGWLGLLLPEEDGGAAADPVKTGDHSSRTSYCFNWCNDIDARINCCTAIQSSPWWTSSDWRGYISISSCSCRNCSIVSTTKPYCNMGRF